MSPAREPPPPDPRSWAVAAAGICTFLNLYPTQALLPTLAAEFHAPVTRTGLTVTAPLLAVALVAPFAGVISDMLGRRRLILGAAFTLVIPTLLAALAPSLPALIALRFAQGLLLPFIFTVTIAYISDEAPGPEGLRLTGHYAAGTIFGGFLGRFIAGWATDLSGWRATFVALGAATLGLALLVAARLPPEKRFQPVRGLQATLAGFALHLSDRRLLATNTIGFGVLFSLVAAFTYANFHLAAPPYRLGPAGLGSIFIVYLLGVTTAPVAATLVQRLGRRPTLAVGAAIAGGGLLLTLLPSLAAATLGLALTAAGVFLQQTLSLGFIGIAARRARSTAVGLYVTSYYVGGSLGGIVPAGIWHQFGWPGCVALVLLVQAVMVGVATAAWKESPVTPAPVPA